MAIMTALSAVTVLTHKEIAMAIDRKTLSMVQFLRLTDRDGVGQSQLVIHNSSIFFPARGRALNNMAAGMEVTGLN